MTNDNEIETDGFYRQAVDLDYGDHVERVPRLTRVDSRDSNYASVIIDDVWFLAEWDEDEEIYVVDMNQE